MDIISNIKSRSFFEWIGIFISVVSVLSLFGKLGIVTFEEWLDNFLESYRNLFHPIINFILYPFMIVINFDLNSAQKDALVFYIFLLNRYIIDMISHSITNPNTPVKIIKYSNKLDYFINKFNVVEKMFLDLTKRLFKLLQKYKTIQIALSTFLAILFVISENNQNSYWFIGKYKTEVEAFANLFVILFIFPIFLLTMFLIQIIVELFRMIIFFILKITANNITHDEYSIKKVVGNWKNSKSLEIADRQVKFNIYFISILLVMVGVGREQGWL